MTVLVVSVEPSRKCISAGAVVVRACPGLRLTRSLVLAGRRPVGLVLRVWYVPDVDDELIAVGRENRDRHAQRCPRLVEGGTENLENGGIVRQPEECCSLRSGLRAVIHRGTRPA